VVQICPQSTLILGDVFTAIWTSDVLDSMTLKTTSFRLDTATVTGKGRSKADSITGPLGTQIILFFGYVKQHAYKRTKAADPIQQVPTDSHIRGAIDGLKRMQIHSYANEAEKRNRLGEIIQNVEALFNFQLNNIDY
jgi:hypothetical protein